jgi:hypothetical protein
MCEQLPVYETKPSDGRYKAELEMSRDNAVFTREKFTHDYIILWMYQCNVINCGQRLRHYSRVLEHREMYHGNIDWTIPTLVFPLRGDEPNNSRERP